MVMQLFFIKTSVSSVYVAYAAFYEFRSLNCTVMHGHKYKLYKSHSNVCTRSTFFTQRVLNTWNGLPSHVDFSSFSCFKRTVKRLNFDGLRF